MDNSNTVTTVFTLSFHETSCELFVRPILQKTLDAVKKKVDTTLRITTRDTMN